MDNAVRPRAPQRLAGVGHLLAGERHSRSASASPVTPPAGSIAAAYFGTADVVGPSNAGGNGLAPATPAIRGSAAPTVGEKILDINCIGVPAFGENGDVVPPYNIRTPTRVNHDLTLFKNFEINGDQKLQFRVGFFNLFNQAFANTVHRQRHQPDARHDLQRRGERRPERHRRPSRTSATRRRVSTSRRRRIDNFGKINLKRGHRVIEFVLKYYF